MSLNLIDIDTKEVIVLSLGVLNTLPYNPRVVFTYEPTTLNSNHSVQFFQDGTRVQTENVHPYVLSGDISGAYSVWKNIPQDSDFTVSIKEFSEKNGSGTVVKELSTKLHFSTTPISPPVTEHSLSIKFNGQVYKLEPETPLDVDVILEQAGGKSVYLVINGNKVELTSSLMVDLVLNEFKDGSHELVLCVDDDEFPLQDDAALDIGVEVV